MEDSKVSPKNPHGIGNPDNKKLRKVETDILIAERVRTKARTEKCIPEVAEFTKCLKAEGLKIWYKCRQENDVLKTCLNKWYHDEGLWKQCTDEYLAERSEYRRTGVKQATKKLKSTGMYGV